MPFADHPLSKSEFDAVYAKVPRLTVELIVKNDAGELYLTKRAPDIQPCPGQWHLPGGTVRFGEPVIEAVKRIAARELGIEVKQAGLKGYIDYPSHYLLGLDSPVALAFEIVEYDGQPARDVESERGGWFKHFPQPMHADQDVFLEQHGYITAPASS